MAPRSTTGVVFKDPPKAPTGVLAPDTITTSFTFSPLHFFLYYYLINLRIECFAELSLNKNIASILLGILVASFMPSLVFLYIELNP
jgi:hypothetical protein